MGMKKQERKEPIISPWYPGKFEDNRPAHLRFDWESYTNVDSGVLLAVDESWAVLLLRLEILIKWLTSSFKIKAFKMTLIDGNIYLS